jgi:hypothetical protein
MVEGSASYVLRVDPSTLEDLERSDTAARESVFDRAVAEATSLREISELTSEAMRPVREIIAARGGLGGLEEADRCSRGVCRSCQRA